MRRSLEDALLLCGAISSPLYIAADIAAATRWSDYRYAAQSISELAAVGAPTRAFLVTPFFAYDLLVAALGVGVLCHPSAARALRAAGGWILAYAIVGVIGLFVTPLHLVEGRIAEGDPANALHVVGAAVTVLLMFAFMGFAAAARGHRFRVYTAITIVALLVCGGLVFLAAFWPPARPLQSVLGVLERVNVYGCMLWLMVLAIALLRDMRGRRAPNELRGSAASSPWPGGSSTS